MYIAKKKKTKTWPPQKNGLIDTENKIVVTKEEREGRGAF